MLELKKGIDILADVGGGLWLSSYHCALRGFNGEVWDEYDSGSRGDLLARGPGGTVYAAGRGGAIRRYDGTARETLLPAEPSRGALVTDLAVGPKGEVWVAFDGPPGLLVHRDGEWEEPLESVDAAITALLAQIVLPPGAAVSLRRTPTARPSSMRISSTGQLVRITAPLCTAARWMAWK